jgi:predicted dehydrogenase
MTKPIDPSRRDFLRRTATAAGAGIITAELPQRATAQPSSPNGRIGVGIIGCGGMGNHHMEVLVPLKNAGMMEIVAVCDVFSKRLEAAAAKTGGKPYKHWSDLLADKRVDVVLITTPDHWHAPLTLAALEAGKDVYCEKPMVHWDHLDLAGKVVEAVEKNKRVMQVGTQLISDDIWRIAKDRIPSLGKIVHVRGCDCRNGLIPCYAAFGSGRDAVPGKTLDWDTWLGCEMTRAPKREYDPRRYYAFRAFWDYSAGPVTDQLPHVFTPFLWALDLGLPKRVMGGGGLYLWRDGREVPDIVNVCIDYEGGPTVDLLGSLASRHSEPKVIRGAKAAMVFGETNEPLVIISEMALGGGEPTKIKGKEGLPIVEHWRNLLTCVKTRKKPISNEVIGYRVMVALSMAIKSYRSGKTLTFEPQSRTVKEL